MNRFKRIIKSNLIVYKLLLLFYRPVKYLYKLPQHIKLSKEAINVLSKVDTNNPNIFYFGIPVHSNLGDQAQTYCTELWCKKYFDKYNLVEFKSPPVNENRYRFLEILKSKIKKNDILLIQSGYCTVDHHIDHKMHKILVSNFPDNQIIILPQTVNLKSKSEIIETAETFNNHKNLYFITRDKKSYSISKNIFKNTRIDLCPDIVTTLIGKYHFDDKRSGILFCMRNDEEKFYTDNIIQKLIKKYKSYGRADIWDTTLNMDYSSMKKNIETLLFDTFKKFSSYKMIITDRFHGTIFSLIANTPVIVLATNDHKVISGAEWFLEDYSEYIYIAKSLDSLEEIVNTILNKKEFESIHDIFEIKYYKKLANKIMELSK